jgi:SAM-dependent methyltransferase
MSDENTLKYYNSAALDYEATIAAQKTPALTEFSDQFAKGARILDLGCGPGHCAAVFASHGLIVDAIDASEEMIALAQKHQGVNAKVATFDDVEHTDEYDGIWANFSLLHLEKSALPDTLKRLNVASKTNALLHVGLKIGEGSRIDHLGRFYSYYSVDEIKYALSSAGFAPFHEQLGSGKGMSGLDEPWVIIWARYLNGDE